MPPDPFVPSPRLGDARASSPSLNRGAELKRVLPNPELPNGPGPSRFSAPGGNGLDTLGVALQRFADTRLKAEAVNDTNAARVQGYLALSKLEEDVGRNPDPRARADQFEKGAQQIQRQIEQSLGSDARDAFRSEYAQMAATKLVGVRRGALRIEAESAVTTLDEIGSRFPEGAAKAQSSAERTQLLTQASQAILDAAQAGWITNDEAKRRIGGLGQAMDRFTVKAALDASPEGAVRLLSDPKLLPHLAEEERTRWTADAEATRDRKIEERGAETALHSDEALAEGLRRLSGGTLDPGWLAQAEHDLAPGDVQAFRDRMAGALPRDAVLAGQLLEDGLYGGPSPAVNRAFIRGQIDEGDLKRAHLLADPAVQRLMQFGDTILAAQVPAADPATQTKLRTQLLDWAGGQKSLDLDLVGAEADRIGRTERKQQAATAPLPRFALAPARTEDDVRKVMIRTRLAYEAGGINKTELTAELRRIIIWAGGAESDATTAPKRP